MTSPVRPYRRVFAWTGLGLVVALGVLVLARKPLTAAVISSSLRAAGAGEIQLRVTEASPWGVLVENLGFRIRTQRFDAQRVRIERAHWWSPSLGAVQVEGARVPVTVDGSDTNPWAWATYENQNAPAAGGAPVLVPADRVTIDGVLVIKAAAQPDQEVTVKFSAELGAQDRVAGRVEATGAGLAVEADVSYELQSQAVGFKLRRAELDLAVWQGHLQSIVVLPGGRWELAGRLAATAEGRYADKKLAASGTVQLRDGRCEYRERDVVAEGVQADLVFTDFDRVISQPGAVKIRTLRAGGITMQDADLEFAFGGPDKIAVTRAHLRAFGGKLSAEPFNVFTRQNELEFTLLADGIIVEQVMALTKDVPATAKGVVDGRLPVRVDGGGLRFGTGWLELKRGTYAEVQFNAVGLLTRGVSATSPTYPTLKKIEGGLLRLEVKELRLDIRPPDQPANRSARIHIVGEPVDKEVKAPVTLDLNVNGPFEQLLNLGFDRRVNFGPKR